MKTFFKIVISIILVCSLSYFVFYTYLSIFVDNPVVYARDNYPLEKKQAYIIELNHSELDEEGNTILEENMFYTFRKPDEDRQYPYLSGRHIGSSKVNINEYLGKKVYIYGNFAMGLPIILKDKNIPEFLVREEKVILMIDSLELAK